MSDLLSRLDATIDGLCNCGAEPREGSAYCSDDCVPTHRGIHTVSDRDGTEMRWRPDLVSEVDDTDLMDLGSNTFYAGRYNAHLFQRGSEINGLVTWHLRLDDGFRFVGANLTDVGLIDDDLKQRIAEKWAALERELGNTRHVEPGGGDPWDDVMDRVFSSAAQRWADDLINYGRVLDNAEQITRAAMTSARTGDSVTVRLQQGEFHPTPATTWDSTLSDPLEDMRRFASIRAGLLQGDRIAEDIRSMAPTFQRAAEQIQSSIVPGHVWTVWPDRCGGQPEAVEPAHPMLAAIESRRVRNTGPELARRAPRQINPRRGR